MGPRETGAKETEAIETGGEETEVREKGRPEEGGCLPEASQGSTGLSLSATPYIVAKTCHWPGQGRPGRPGKAGTVLGQGRPAGQGRPGQGGEERDGSGQDSSVTGRPCGQRVGPFPSRGPGQGSAELAISLVLGRLEIHLYIETRRGRPR